MIDTIFAVSSGNPPAAIAIMRLSGPDAFAAVERLAGHLPPARHATLRSLVDPASGELLDRAVVLLFPGPGSATGENLAELHLHGGRAVVRAVGFVLAALDGLRPAEPGEFTRRALTNGRIDLTEAEGLGDLLAAETEGQRRAAMTSADGGLRRLIEAWSDRALVLAAQLEAGIDHSDEDDVDEEAIAVAFRQDVAALRDTIVATLAQPPAERLHDGLRVVLAGPPNSGKSSLFNAMAGRDAAIVSPIAGTTRDRIEASIVHEGVAWLLIDTAGIADATSDPIEAIGIDRTRRAMEQADVVLWLGDDAPPAGAIAIHAKSDLPDRTNIPEGRVAASVVDERLDAVWDAVHTVATTLVPDPSQPILNVRQRQLCKTVADLLDLARSTSDPLIAAEHLRAALATFDRLTGRTGTEAMLAALFARFCIGK